MVGILWPILARRTEEHRGESIVWVKLGMNMNMNRMKVVAGLQSVDICSFQWTHLGGRARALSVG